MVSSQYYTSSYTCIPSRNPKYLKDVPGRASASCSISLRFAAFKSSASVISEISKKRSLG